MTVFEKEDWRSLIGLVTNAKQVVNSVQDLASKLADYAKFRSMTSSSGEPCLGVLRSKKDLFLIHFFINISYLLIQLSTSLFFFSNLFLCF